MQISFIDVVGFIMTIIMGFFMKEIRSISKSREDDLSMLSDKRDSMRKDLEGKGKELKEELEGQYLSLKQHDLLCSNTTLRLEAYFTKEIKSSEDRIIHAIKSNGYH